MKNLIRIGQKIENTILVTSFIVMSLSAFAQVVNRNLIGAGISWFEELARYCMVYMALLGTEVGLRDGSQIAITAVVDKFKGVSRGVIDIFAKIVVVLFSVTVFYTSFTLLEKQISFGQFSPGLNLPMYVPYAALPLSFGMISLVQGATLIAMIVSFFRGENGENRAGEGGVA